ncbi:unnamed protein product [Clonostachys byssicola]|uniref:Prion-inhibition and propagation HeLo domain-containing protein n=1 Tax=Clonostachys byssicola TaxID=160290 RepID=A0A9N9XXZ5_9HYPO|nr:unnamed protein product [Clonostachys byssicola]
MEAAGFALSVVAILLSIKGAIDTAVFIESCFDGSKSEYGSTALAYHIEKVRLQLWAEHCRLSDPLLNILRDRPDLIQKAVLQVLREVEHLHHEASKLLTKHKMKLPHLPGDHEDAALDASTTAMTLITGSQGDQSSLLSSSVRQTHRVKSKIRWLIKSKPEFEKIISDLREHNKALRDLTLTPAEARVLIHTLPCRVLPALDNASALNALDESGATYDPAIAFSARAKAIQKNLASSQGLGISATLIADRQLKALGGSFPDTKLLHCTDGRQIQVWVEWKVLSLGDESAQQAKRIQSMGYLLEQVGEPVLRLPRCYGLIEDFSYMESHGARRMGYVMGPPISPSPRSFESNIAKYPPCSLADLLRTQSGGMAIPLLGDRFALAYYLASAFGLFQSTGWLHKGFQSKSILLFRGEGPDAVLSVLDPFITGFQHSRPDNENSLSHGPLEDKATEYYYHPDAHQGFTKTRDLYSLGVVLYEIARWNLVPDTVRPEKRKRLVNRAAWRDHMVAKALPELGWRAGAYYQKAVGALIQGGVLPEEGEGGDDGDYFAQQYYDKIIRPLINCDSIHWKFKDQYYAAQY